MIVDNGSRKDPDDLDDDESVESTDDDVVVADDDDNIGDLSVEINVEELVAKLEATGSDDVERRRAIRRRLDELRDEQEAEKELDSTYNFNLDDELR